MRALFFCLGAFADRLFQTVSPLVWRMAPSRPPTFGGSAFAPQRVAVPLDGPSFAGAPKSREFALSPGLAFLAGFAAAAVRTAADLTEGRGGVRG